MNAFRAAAPARLRCQFAVAQQELRLLLIAVEVLVPHFVVVVPIPVPVVAVPKHLLLSLLLFLCCLLMMFYERQEPYFQSRPPQGPKCRGGGGGGFFGRCAPCVASLPAVDLPVAIGIPIAVNTSTIRRLLPCHHPQQRKHGFCIQSSNSKALRAHARSSFLPFHRVGVQVKFGDIVKQRSGRNVDHGHRCPAILL